MRTQRETVGDHLKRMTATDLGLLFGITKQAIGLWHSRTGCPRNADGTYDLAEVCRWYRRWCESRAEVSSDWDEEGRKWRALNAKLEYEVESGKYTLTSEIANFWTERVLEARTALQGMGQAIAPQCVGLEARAIQELIDERHRRICDDLARSGAGDEESEPDAEEPRRLEA